MGYEYELDWDDCGPPGNESHLLSLDDDYDTHWIKRPKTKKIEHPIKDLPNYFHCTYEGLGNREGYEIKSVIAPLSIHKLLIRKLFKDVTFNNQPNGHKNEGGIHVSVSRNVDTEADHWKVFNFLHSGLTYAQALAISERDSNTFDLYCPQRPDGNISRYDNDYTWWHEHYNIINKENRERFELRLFAAQKHLLLPALEMADSLFTMAREVESINTESWMNFIKDKRKYRDIYNHAKVKL